MKTSSFAVVLSGALLLAAPALAQTTAPSRAPAQGAAAATLPDAFEGDAPAASTPPASPPVAGPAAQAPDIARSEEALRRVIAAFQTNQIDYAVFSTDMAEQIRAQSGAVAPLIQQFGALKTIEHRGQQSGADMFRVVFEKQATDWVIAFDDQDQIAALLFRPAQD
ncbi:MULTISPECIES: hypothetical protein [Brevundimonas]|uniref:hypothetical protein n=1 Tax=Brevundimonas TaxID=41275 RepID=UPI00257FF590|nr:MULTISPECIES: hypothetical protein [Brevundimonas]